MRNSNAKLHIQLYSIGPDMVNVLTFKHFLSVFSKKMMVIKAGILQMLVKIANREDPDQNAS